MSTDVQILKTVDNIKTAIELGRSQILRSVKPFFVLEIIK